MEDVRFCLGFVWFFWTFDDHDVVFVVLWIGKSFGWKHQNVTPVDLLFSEVVWSMSSGHIHRGLDTFTTCLTVKKKLKDSTFL